MKRKKPSGRVLLHKPPLLPEPLSDLFARGDFVEIEYYQCDEIRKRKRKTPDQIERLKKHDAVEIRIKSDPKTVLREAHEALDHGTVLLLKLIRAKSFTHALEPTEKGIAAGVKTHRWDEAIDCMVSRLSFLNRELVRLAEINAPNSCGHLWYEAKTLAAAFTRLATVYPEEFRQMAEGALLMPSLRAKSPKFTADAEAITRAIHLSESHPTPNVWDNNSRVGALCHLVVSEIIESIHSARRQYESEGEILAMLKSGEHAAEYRDMTVEQKLEGRLYPTLFEHVLACAALPAWSEGRREWWKRRVLPMVKERFAELAKNPVKNFALWTELKRGGERDTQNDMRRYMEKICKNKFDQIVRECP